MGGVANLIPQTLGLFRGEEERPEIPEPPEREDPSEMQRRRSRRRRLQALAARGYQGTNLQGPQYKLTSSGNISMFGG